MAELPEGFSFADTKSELPEGFSWADEKGPVERFVARRPGPSLVGMISDLVSAPRQLVQQATTGEFNPATLVSATPVGTASVQTGRVAGRMIPEAARALDEAVLSRGTPLPAGRMVGAEEAGGVIRPKVEASPIPVPGLAGAQTNEAMFERLMNLGTSSAPQDLQVLHRMRASVPPEDWAKVQTAALDSYDTLSRAGKKAIFPDENQIKNIDNFFEVSKRSEKWAALDASKQQPGIPGWAYGAAAIASLVSPSHALAGIVGAMGLKRALSQPAGAAAAARWARRYEGVVRSPSAGTLSAFTLATKDLNNTLNINVPVSEYLKAANIDVQGPKSFTDLLANPSGDVNQFPGMNALANQQPTDESLALARGQ